jgi:antitoxin MazE
MITRIQKWGNSQGLRFSKGVLELAQIRVGDEVEISVRGRMLVIEPLKKVRGRYDLRELVARMPEDYLVQEVDLGPPRGKEVW